MQKPKLINKQIVQHTGGNIIQYSFEYKKIMPLTTVRSYLKWFSKDAKTRLNKIKLNGDIFFSYYFDKIGHWMPSVGVSVGDMPKIYSPEEEYGSQFSGGSLEGIRYFDIYIQPMKRAGGQDTHNDCLYNAIWKAMQGNTGIIPQEIRIPARLKTFLKLNRDDKIDISDIHIIDKLFTHHKIVVYGDAEYISGKNTNLTIRLRLKNGHYELMSNENRKTKVIRSSVNIENKKVISYEKNFEHNTMNIYDGHKIEEVELDAFYKMKDPKSNYITLPVLDSKDTLESVYELRLKQRDELMKATNGKTDIYKYFSITDCILDTFRNFSKTLNEPDAITPEEAKFIDSAFMGGLMYADNGYEGEIHGYDSNSFYPSILSTSHFMFPVKQGQFLSLSEAEFKELKYFKYGIYRCIITGESKIFRFNYDNYYTHHDLTRAKELGFKIDIICDEQSNFLYYSKSSLVGGHQVFDLYVKYFYKLKQDGNKTCKLFLNLVWGILCQKETISKVALIDEKPVVKESERLISISPRLMNREKNKFTYVNQTHIYKTNYARLGAFLTSFTRLKMSRIVQPYEKDLKRIHTDGFYLTHEINDLDIGIELGQFKKEKSGYYKIHHINKLELIKNM